MLNVPARSDVGKSWQFPKGRPHIVCQGWLLPGFKRLSITCSAYFEMVTHHFVQVLFCHTTAVYLNRTPSEVGTAKFAMMDVDLAIEEVDVALE